ncbi:hypothetical protein LSH36_425g02053 [Paralvinella palmiformis]|uniref:Uncharacterized protein n=1 Tax=Paralvinella palmiformis TaxID=53620 RepID=A0AAD9MYE9_9ANNE|nr:hypothetical protein LSH36_425g02053 [Paralvinella palmiformis]
MFKRKKKWILQESSRSSQVRLAAIRPRHNSLISLETENTGTVGTYQKNEPDEIQSHDNKSGLKDTAADSSLNQNIPPPPPPAESTRSGFGKTTAKSPLRPRSGPPPPPPPSRRPNSAPPIPQNSYHRVNPELKDSVVVLEDLDIVSNEDIIRESKNKSDEEKLQAVDITFSEPVVPPQPPKRRPYIDDEHDPKSSVNITTSLRQFLKQVKSDKDYPISGEGDPVHDRSHFTSKAIRMESDQDVHHTDPEHHRYTRVHSHDNNKPSSFSHDTNLEPTLSTHQKIVKQNSDKVTKQQHLLSLQSNDTNCKMKGTKRKVPPPRPNYTPKPIKSTSPTSSPTSPTSPSSSQLPPRPPRPVPPPRAKRSNSTSSTSSNEILPGQVNYQKPGHRKIKLHLVREPIDGLGFHWGRQTITNSIHVTHIEEGSSAFK